ncbi:citrate/2-methylcitrate synthase [Spirochaeta lutea]|uniref:citrate synthase (unknown stereospecificity) n=1 Tax=Spirochaeta lutea TaxID=1480694 RepID=A0A098R4J6_9SPIO|nr:citrate/2-methylcitrate synthase [Spirochaeta lutea]KGE73682.1 citrate synthase [Spirochaeta lutea]
MDENTFLDEHAAYAGSLRVITPESYSRYGVKRGLRNDDGTGVLVGLTEIGDVHGYILDEGEKTAVEGRLRYRGIDVKDIVSGFQQDNRFGYEETVYLLLFGTLPTQQQLSDFIELLGEKRSMPTGYWEDIIMRSPSTDIMNKLGRAVLGAYSYDQNPEDYSIKNILRQCIELIARFPALVAYSYQSKRRFFDNESLHVHSPDPRLSTAENFLQMIRPDQHFTKLEAEVLDLALVLHAEHGGGNNSAFTVHVVSSAYTDTYSAISAAVGSLKGLRHGGANNRVMGMMHNLQEKISSWDDSDAIASHLRLLLEGREYDNSGLIYGMGHAIYTLSDPRAILLKAKAEELAQAKGGKLLEEFELYKRVEILTPEVFRRVKKSDKVVAPNVDFYSGFVYKMLNIPPELYTPIFALSRIAGWAAHRMEELSIGSRIYRPAYKNVLGGQAYSRLNDR